MSQENCTNKYTFCWDNKPEVILYFSFHMPMTIFGVLTNILNLFVFRKQLCKIHISAYILLQWIAVADLLTCVFVFPIAMCRCLAPRTPLEIYIQQFYEIYIYIPVGNIFVCWSLWLTVVVSLERYMSIAMPLYARNVWTEGFIRKIIYTLILAALLINIPDFFVKEISPEPPAKYTDWGLSQGATIYAWFRFAFINAIPTVSIIILNVLVIIEVVKVNKKRNVMNHTENSMQSQARNRMQKRTTAMVVSISVVYVICHSIEPFAHPGIISSILGICNMYGPNHRLLIACVNCLEVFSFTTNFCFYCIFNRQFFEALKKIGCKQNNQVQDVGTTGTNNSVY